MPEEKVTKYFLGKVRSVDPKTFTAEVVISDETKDRYDERVLVSSFAKTKKDFMKHPVLLSSHAYRGLMNQLGVFESLKIDNDAKEVIAKPKWFVGEGNPEADWGWKLAEKGVAAFSIGFIPKKWTSYDEEARAKNGGIWRDFDEIELLEVSQVLIPANPSALQKSFGDTKDDVFLSNLSEKILEAFNESKSEEALEEIEWEAPAVTLSGEGTGDIIKDATDEKVKGDLLPEIKKELTFEEEYKAALEELKKLMLEQKEMMAEFKALVAEMKSVQTPAAAPTEIKTEEVVSEIKKEETDGIVETPPPNTDMEETLGEEKMAELRASLFGENKSSNIEDLKVIFSKMTDEAKGIFSVQQ